VPFPSPARIISVSVSPKAHFEGLPYSQVPLPPICKIHNIQVSPVCLPQLALQRFLPAIQGGKACFGHTLPISVVALRAVFDRFDCLTEVLVSFFQIHHSQSSPQSSSSLSPNQFSASSSR